MEKTIKFKKNKLIISTHIKDFEFKFIDSLKYNKQRKKIQLSNNNSSNRIGVYCFVKDKTILYVGKTDTSLISRIKTYIYPGNTQQTNIRINKVLKQFLKNKKENIDIYFLDCNKFKHLKCKDKSSQITSCRIIEMIVTGYCWNKNLLNK